ncbi:WD40 repeat domain-containing protein [Tundrisphaera lichenicola]|uniref:WD40 repeat domain-containing protein n=1 Tax=Tundrisphaera lichenicola TaxID=2029860 RepID=UPI003EC0315E
MTRTYPTEEMILWDVASGRKRETWKATDKRRRFAGAFSPDGRTYASPWFIQGAGTNFSIDLIDAGTGRVRSTIASPQGGFLGLRFRNGGSTLRLLAVGPNAHTLLDIDVATGVVVESRAVASTVSTNYLGFNALSADGRWLALTAPISAGSTVSPTRLSIWDLDRDVEAFQVATPPGAATPSRVAFSPDGKTLAVAREDGSVEFWDLATKILVHSTAAHERDYASVDLKFSPDGKTLASTGNVRLLRTLSLNFVRAVIDHYLLGPDQAERMELILVDTSFGRRLRSSHRDGIAVFSPDGRSVATSHEDGSVRIYDLP